MSLTFDRKSQGSAVRWRMFSGMMLAISCKERARGVKNGERGGQRVRKWGKINVDFFCKKGIFL